MMDEIEENLFLHNTYTLYLHNNCTCISVRSGGILAGGGLRGCKKDYMTVH